MSSDAGDDSVVRVGNLVGGLVITCVAGVFNGSWNASFSSKLGLAVAKTRSCIDETPRKTNALRRNSSFIVAKTRHLFGTTDRTGEGNGGQTSHHDLSYNHAFMLFQVYAVFLNIPICILWVGGAKRTTYIVSQAPASSIALVIVFSLLWGIGSLLFGLACRLAGVGLGTNLTMGVVVVLGTLLPMLMQGVHATVAGGIIFAGLFVSCVALYFSMSSLQTRGDDNETTQRATSADTEQIAKTGTDDEDTETANKKAGEYSFDNLVEEDEIRIVKDDWDPQNVHRCTAEGKDQPLEISKHQENSVLKNVEMTERLNENHDWDPQNVTQESLNSATKTSKENDLSSFAKIGICILAGVLASQLQFAFVFGQPLVDIAENDTSPDHGSTPEGGSASIVWLFAISLGSIPSIVYSLYNNPDNIPLKTIWLAPWWRHALVVLTTSVPWVAHIHLYGWANSLLPPNVAASVAWPVLMMVTVGQGMILSVCLGEWKGASRKAWRQLAFGLVLAFVGICLIMASLAA